MRTQHGFTLIELMVTVAVIGILTAIAMPSYAGYLLRAKVPVGLEQLASYQARMEQTYQDTGSYGSTACAATIPTVANFSLSCTLSAAGQGFTASIVGVGPVAGVSYSVDQDGTRLTLSHPNGLPNQSCWTIRGGTCDS